MSNSTDLSGYCRITRPQECHKLGPKKYEVGLRFMPTLDGHLDVPLRGMIIDRRDEDLPLPMRHSFIWPEYHYSGNIDLYATHRKQIEAGTAPIWRDRSRENIDHLFESMDKHIGNNVPPQVVGVKGLGPNSTAGHMVIDGQLAYQFVKQQEANAAVQAANATNAAENGQ